MYERGSDWRVERESSCCADGAYGPEQGGRGGCWRVEREAIGLGFRARGETVRVENGDGGGDGDFLHFYVAITLPQMPLSKIDGVVNLFFARRAKETSNFRCMLAGLLGVVRNQIFGACWLDCSARCSIETGIYSVF